MASKPGVVFKPDLATVRARIAKRIRELLDRSEPNRKVAVVLDRWVQRNFRGQGALVGKWTPFKRGGRRIPGGGLDKRAKLLQDTGALRGSFHSFWDKNVAGIGSSLEYAKFHEDGTGNIPLRRILPTEDDESVMRPIFNVYNSHYKSLTGKKLW